jgi:hypothetical protein
MDPYSTLGVRWNCSYEEAREAFRIKALQLHPDRGGPDEPFIQLRAAYEQVLAELNRRPRPAAMNPTPPMRSGVSPTSLDPRQDSELIVFETPLPHHRAPKPPDPTWDPDLIVLPKPPKPNWDPDLVVTEVTPDSDRILPSNVPVVTRESYVDWLQRDGTRISRGDSVWRKLVRTIIQVEEVLDRTRGMIILLGVVIATLWICWVAWTYDPEAAASQRQWEATHPRKSAGDGQQGRSDE